MYIYNRNSPGLCILPWRRRGRGGGPFGSIRELSKGPGRLTRPLARPPEPSSCRHGVAHRSSPTRRVRVAPGSGDLVAKTWGGELRLAAARWWIGGGGDHVPRRGRLPKGPLGPKKASQGLSRRPRCPRIRTSVLRCEGQTGTAAHSRLVENPSEDM